MTVPSQPTSWSSQNTCFCQLPLMAGHFTQIILQGIDPWVFANDLLVTQTKSAQGWRGHEPSHEWPRTPKPITNSVETESKPTSAILFFFLLVVPWQLEKVKAACVQPVAWSSTFVIPEPVDWIEIMYHISCKKTGRNGRITKKEHALPPSLTHTALGATSYQWCQTSPS